MNDQDIEHRLAGLRNSWRVPEEPLPLDQIWSAVEREAFTAPVRRPTPWIRTLLPLAAMLVLGFGIGQIAPRLGSEASTDPASPLAGSAGQPAAHASASEAPPFVGVATDYLERVTALLVTLASESSRQPAQYSAGQARDLLTTTRLLMDTPYPLDASLRTLLEDLELVLAQIARLPARPTAPDVYLIDQALDQREVIPRLRVYLAENPSSQP
jgi:hypothetical protein